ncbi:MAG: phage major capsid protein [Gallionellaceae bacterium]
MAQLGELNAALKAKNANRYQNLMRFMIAETIGKGDRFEAHRATEWKFKATPLVGAATKSYQDAIGTANSTLVPQSLRQEIQQLMRSVTVMGQLEAYASMIPFNQRAPREQAAAGGGWTGQGAPLTVTDLTLDVVSLPQTKIGTIFVMDAGFVKVASPAVEISLSNTVKAQMSQVLDANALDPSIAAVTDSSGVGLIASPASLTNAGTQISSTGSSGAQIMNDLQNMIATPGALRRPVWIMSIRTAVRLAGVLTAGGQLLFPGIHALGGELLGIPVVTTAAMPIPAASPQNTSFIVLLEASDLLIADDGNFEIEFSTETSLQMNTTPATGGQNLTSMFQTAGVATKITQTINWELGHTTSCVWMEAPY